MDIDRIDLGFDLGLLRYRKRIWITARYMGLEKGGLAGSEHPWRVIQFRSFLDARLIGAIALLGCLWIAGGRIGYGSVR